MTQRLAPLVVGTLVLVAGCMGGTTQTPTSINPIEQHNTVYFTGTATVSNGSFVMEGRLVGCFGQIGPERCRNTRILLYAENGTLLESEYVGVLNGRRNVSLVTARIPHYVILTSPDVWGANHTTVRYLFRDGDLYLSGAVIVRDELPVAVGTPTTTVNSTV